MESQQDPAAEPLRQRAFRGFWSASTLTFFGAAITMVAIDALVINELGASESEVGVIRAVQFLPYLMVGLFAGALVDRWRKKTSLVWTTLGGGLVLGVIPLLWFLDRLSLLAVGLVLFGSGVFAVFTAAAQQSILPSLVQRRQLVIANARLGQSMTVTQTSGPPLGGAAVSLIGAPLSILVSSVSHLVSAMVLARVKVTEPEKEPREPTTIWRDMAQGVRFLYRHRTLTPLALSTHIWFIANSAAVTVFALYALRHLGLSPFLYGITLAVAGVAGLSGAFAAPWLGRLLGEGSAVAYTRLLYPVAWVVVLLAPQDPVFGFVLLCLGQALHGFAMGLEDPNEMGYCQAVTPPGLLGRMHATMRSANRTMAVVGSLLGGVAAGVLGYTVTLWAIVAVFLTASILLILSPVRGASSEDAEA